MKKFILRNSVAASVVCLLMSACVGDSPERSIATAKEHLQKNDLKSAAIQIKSALQINPDLPEARFLLGSILLDEGNARAAEVEFRKALAAKYSENLVVPELVRSMLLQGKAKKLTEEFGEIRLDQSAAKAKFQTTLAVAYGAIGKPDLADAALTVALQADSAYVPALLARSRQAALAKNFDAALQGVESILTKDPKNAEAWKLKGDILLVAGNKVDDALAEYRKSIAVNPTFLPGHLALLTVLMQQGKAEEASKQLEQVRGFSANHPQIKYIDAQLALQKKNFKRAQELSQQLLKSSPSSPLLLQLAGAAELGLNSLAQAEAYLTKAVTSAPQLVIARRLLVQTYLRSGQIKKALVALNAASGKEGLDPALFSLAGEVYLQGGDAAKAELYFTKALKLDPENSRKRAAVAITRLASGETDAAFDELQASAASGKDTTADLALISARLRRMEFDKALVAVDKLEAKQPDKPLAANLRGRIQLVQRNNAGARKSFERALALDPTFFSATVSLAALDMAEQRPDEAKKRFEGLLAKNPKDGQALLALAELAVSQRASKEEILALLTKAVDANPTDVTPRVMLIDFYLRTHNAKQAVATAQSALAALPKSPDVLDALGRAQQASGDLNQAIATFGRLVAALPLSPQPHVRLAGAYLANNNKQAAEQSLRKALEVASDDLDAQRTLITMALDSRMYGDALKTARLVQQQRPKAAVGFALEGDIHTARKDWTAAAAAYRSALKFNQITEIASKLHAVMINARKDDEAEQFALNWIKAHPKDSEFLAYRATVALARADNVAAEKAYQGLLQIDPNNAAALNNLAWITRTLKKDGALNYAEKANKLAPNTAAYMDTLATLLSEKGEYARAADLQTKALSMQPTSPALRLNLVKIYIASGDKARARTELDVLAKLGDKNPLQREVAALLKNL